MSLYSKSTDGMIWMQSSIKIKVPKIQIRSKIIKSLE